MSGRFAMNLVNVKWIVAEGGMKTIAELLTRYLRLCYPLRHPLNVCFNLEICLILRCAHRLILCWSVDLTHNISYETAANNLSGENYLKLLYQIDLIFHKQLTFPVKCTL